MSNSVKVNTRENNSMKNLVVGMFNQVIMLMLNFAVKTVFIRKIGIEMLGINGLLTNIFFILSVVQFSVGSIYSYFLYKPLAEDDKQKIALLYNYIRKIYIITSLLIFVVGLALLPFTQLLVDLDISNMQLYVYYLLYLSIMTITNMFMYNPYLIIADQRKYITSFVYLLTDGIAFIIQIILINTTQNFTLYLLVAFIKSIVFAIVISRVVHKRYDYIHKKEYRTGIAQKDKTLLISRVKDSILYKLANVVLEKTDNIVISVIIGTIWVGFYSNYYLIIFGVTGLIHVFYSAISASVGNMLVKESSEEKYKIFSLIQLIDTWVTAFTATCLLVLLQHFITLWISDYYLLDAGTMFMIVLNFYFICYRNSTIMFITTNGMYNKIKRVMVVAAIMNVGLSVLLGYYFGVLGVVLSKVITFLATYYWYEARLLMNKIFMKSVKIYFLNHIKSITFTALCVLSTYFTASFLDASSVTSFVYKVMLCISIPNILFVAVYWRNPLAKALTVRFLRSLKVIFTR